MAHHHTRSQAVIHRLSRVIGHLEAIKAMVAEGRDCCEVLTQIAAAKAAINNIGREVLKDHIEHCVADAVQEKRATGRRWTTWRRRWTAS